MSPSFFIAGTMQGSRQGQAQVDQSYRQVIREAILEICPSARIFCPGELMKQRLGPIEEELRNSHARLADLSSIKPADLGSGLSELKSTFHELARIAGEADVCIAYLPNHEASMGTAVEMYSAWRNGRIVIAVTDMMQNLAVLACASRIVRNIGELPETLASCLPQLLGRNAQPET